MSPNQTVAYNARKAREQAGLTQAQAAERFSDYLGRPMSAASWSILEGGRQRGSERIRQFDADELVALAQVFDLPVLWFLVPPPGTLAEVWEEPSDSLLKVLLNARGTPTDKRVTRHWKTQVGIGASFAIKLDGPPPFAKGDPRTVAVVVDLEADPWEYVYVPAGVNPIWIGSGQFAGYFLEDPVDGTAPEGALVYSADGIVIGKIADGTIEHEGGRTP